jgi:hypothetical protein
MLQRTVTYGPLWICGDFYAVRKKASLREVDSKFVGKQPN